MQKFVAKLRLSPTVTTKINDDEHRNTCRQATIHFTTKYSQQN